MILEVLTPELSQGSSALVTFTYWGFDSDFCWKLFKEEEGVALQMMKVPSSS